MKTFAELLTEAVHRIGRLEGKGIGQVQDELGNALGKRGRHSLEHWRKADNIPYSITDLETLVIELVKRHGLLKREEVEQFLQSGQHPFAKEASHRLTGDVVQGLTDEQRIEQFQLAGYVATTASNKIEQSQSTEVVLQPGNVEVGTTDIPVRKSAQLFQVRQMVAYLLSAVIAIGFVCILLGLWVNTSRNYPIGLLDDENCLPPPPKLETCPLLEYKTEIKFPIAIEQCQEVQDGLFMKTKAVLTQDGVLNATTQILSDHYLMGFTGRATIYFCNANVELHKIGYGWGVNGRAIYGAASNRIIDWDCPKGDVIPSCYEHNTPLNIVDQEMLDQITHIHIVQLRDPTDTNRRIENSLQELERLFTVVLE